MPWLALGSGPASSQFVPTVGTYIAIALPVVVGLTSADPVDGVLALIFALIYQQIENLTIEPKISADAVDIPPSPSPRSSSGPHLRGRRRTRRGSHLRLLLSLVEIYSHTYDVLPQLRPTPSEDELEAQVRDLEHPHRSLGQRLRNMRGRPDNAAVEPEP